MVRGIPPHGNHESKQANAGGRTQAAWQRSRTIGAGRAEWLSRYPTLLGQTTIAFPNLHRESTLELPVLGAISAIVCGLLLSVSWKLGVIALMPCGLWFLYSAWLGLLNGRLRYLWSRQYSRRVNRRQLHALLETEPERFTIHLHYYGGLDAVSLCPAAVVEDCSTGELSAIYPASWRVPQMCEKLGVRVIQAR